MYFTITIDTECDKSTDWKVSNPMTFNGIYTGVKEILQPLFEKYNIKPVYFISSEVLNDKKSVEILKQIKDEGKAELATHLHADFIAPNIKTNIEGELCNAVQCQYEYDEESQKLKNLTELFVNKFGEKPFSFRAGRYGASINTGKILNTLGYKVDSSVTPGIKWVYSEGIKTVHTIDYSKISSTPYFISRHFDIFEKGNSNFLEVPISIVNAPMNIKNVLRMIKYRKYPKIWFRPFSSNISQLEYIVDNNKNDILVMMFHNMELIPNASPYVRNSEDKNNYINALETIFKHLSERGYKSTTLREYYERK